MGLFGKKKTCDICGKEIKLLGKRKLDDGIMCKDCTTLLSPWFSERKQSTVAQIKEQLAYREENKQAVAQFHTTRTFGERYILHLDEDQNKFLVARTSNLQNENPDVLDFTQVTGCDIQVDERSQEIMDEYRDKEGKTQRRSYIPPRFIYSYDFDVVIRVNHPYFDDIKFRLNRSEVNIEVLGRTLGGFNPSMKSMEYQNYEKLGSEIKEALMNARQEARDSANPAPQMAVTCPWCGATTKPDANGCCEYCGGALNG